MPFANSAALFDTPLSMSLDTRPGPDRAVSAALVGVARLPALTSRMAPLATCHDRVLGERVRADADIPARDSARVDGFAFSGKACRADGPWRLCLTARLAVARNLSVENALPSREAVRITAGAPVPPQLDSVVSAGAVRPDGDYVILDTLPDCRETIAERGSYARCGDVIVEPDRVLDARDLAALTMAGCTGVKVRRALRVAVFSACIGKQEGNGGPGRAMVMAGLDRRWITKQDLGAVTAATLPRALRAASAENDVVIAFDRGGITETIVGMGGRILLDGIAMKPGGDVALAVIDETIILLLPEEPMAALAAMAVLGWPVLRRRAGIQHSRIVPRTGVAAFTLPPSEKITTYPFIKVSGAGEIPTLEIQPEEPSAIVGLSQADGIAIIAPGAGVRFGDRLTWLPITDRFA